MFDAFKVGEKWTTVIPSTIDVDFFDSANPSPLENAVIDDQSCSEYRGLLLLHYPVLLRSGVEFWSRGVPLHGVE